MAPRINDEGGELAPQDAIGFNGAAAWRRGSTGVTVSAIVAVALGELQWSRGLAPRINEKQYCEWARTLPLQWSRGLAPRINDLQHQLAVAQMMLQWSRGLAPRINQEYRLS